MKPVPTGHVENFYNECSSTEIVQRMSSVLLNSQVVKIRLKIVKFGNIL